MLEENKEFYQKREMVEAKFRKKTNLVNGKIFTLVKNYTKKAIALDIIHYIKKKNVKMKKNSCFSLF